MGQCFKPMKAIDAPVDLNDITAAIPNRTQNVAKEPSFARNSPGCDIADVVAPDVAEPSASNDIVNDIDLEHSVESSLSNLSNIAVEKRPSYTPHAQIETPEPFNDEEMSIISNDGLTEAEESDSDDASAYSCDPVPAQQLRLADVNANTLSQVLSSHLNDNNNEDEDDNDLPFKFAKVHANDAALARLMCVARDVYDITSDKTIVFSVRPSVSAIGDGSCVLMRGYISAKALQKVNAVTMMAPVLSPPSMMSTPMASPMFVDYNYQDEIGINSFGNASPSMSSPLEMECSYESSHSALCYPDTFSAGIGTDVAPQISVRMALSEDASVLVSRQLLHDSCGLPLGVAREVLEFLCVSFRCRVVSQGSETETECEDVCYVDVHVSDHEP